MFRIMASVMSLLAMLTIVGTAWSQAEPYPYMQMYNPMQSSYNMSPQPSITPPAAPEVYQGPMLSNYNQSVPLYPPQPYPTLPYPQPLPQPYTQVAYPLPPPVYGPQPQYNYTAPSPPPLQYQPYSPYPPQYSPYPSYPSQPLPYPMSPQQPLAYPPPPQQSYLPPPSYGPVAYAPQAYGPQSPPAPYYPQPAPGYSPYPPPPPSSYYGMPYPPQQSYPSYPPPQPYPAFPVTYPQAPFPPAPYYYGSPMPQPLPGQMIVPGMPVLPSKPHYRIIGTPSSLFLNVNSNGSSPVYSGLVIDLLNALSSVAGFSYSFSIQPDQQYGSQAADGSWNGLIRSLIDGKADIAAADLTITAARESVVDFTLPYYQYNMGILVNKQYPPNGSGNGYTYIIRNNADADYLKNSVSPRDQAIWENITKNFPNSFVDSDKEGMQKVMSGPYAFILESPGLISALSNGNGQLLDKLPEVFPPQFLAFAVPQNSPIREKLSWGIIRLQENGQLQAILNKYLSSSL